MSTRILLGRAVSFLSFVAVAGCGLLGKKVGAGADAEADAAPAVVPVVEAAPDAAAAEAGAAAAAAAPSAPAANENDVSRFPDEKKLDNVSAPVLRTANVREIPGLGKVVASLAKGGSVTQIAQRSTFFLVVFDNPKDQKRLMGWVSQDAFVAPPTVEAGVATIKCVLPETALISDSPFCGKVCAADTDCPSGQACKGAANKLSGVGAKGDAVTVCTVFGAPRPVATASVTPPPVVVPNPPATVGIVAPTSGKCPLNFTLVKDGQCHRNCSSVGACPASARLCVNCAGPTLVCAVNRDICK
jgi:hypothetical protein